MHKKNVKILIFFLFLLPISLLYSDGGYGIDIFMQSPKVIQRRPQEIFSAAFVVQNNSDKQDNFVQKIEAPDGFETIPMQLPTINLRPGQQTVEMFAIKIPDFAKPGVYEITYSLQGGSNPSLLGSATLTLEVLPVQSLEATLRSSQKHVFEGKSYTPELQIINLGNEKKKIALEITSSVGSQIEQSPKGPYTIAPSETLTIDLKVKVPKDVPEGRKDFLQCRVIDANTKVMLANHTLLTNVIVKGAGSDRFSKYNLIPTTATTVAGFQNGKKSVFINVQGSGALNKEQTESISYLFRIPIIQHTSVYRQLGGIPEKYYLSYRNPYFDLYGGDGVYQLTPLTITSRFGRGGSVACKTPKMEIGGLGVAHSSAVPQTEFGAYLRATPLEGLGIQGSYYNTKGRVRTTKIVDKDKANILSISADYYLKEFVRLQVEYAHSDVEKGDLSAQGFFIQSRGKPHKKVWYTFQKIYAPLGFFGYYNNQSQANASLGILITDRINILGSYQTYNLNLSKSREYETANKITRYLGEMTIATPIGMYISASYNTYSLRDFLSIGGYKTNYGSLRLSQTLKWFSMQAIADVGSYKSRYKDSLDRTWQNYSLYTYYRYKGMMYAIYGKWGYLVNLFSINWNQTYGASVNWNFDRFNLRFTYEQAHNKQALTRQYYLAKMSYRFKNKHVLDLYGNILKNFKLENIYRVMVSYKVPFGVPLGKNKERTKIQGRAYVQDRDIIRPMANAIITCNEYQTKTNRKGKYEFEYIPEGSYLLGMEDPVDGYISEEILPKEISMKEKQRVTYDIAFKRPSMLSGEIAYYGIDAGKEGMTELEKTQKAFENLDESGKFSKLGGAVANLTFICKKTKEIIEVRSSAKGVFNLQNLRAGEYKVRVAMEGLSNSYQIEHQEFDIDLLPGEERYLNLRVIPVKRSLKLME